MFFVDQPIHNFDDVMKADKEPFIKLFHALLERNVYLAPSPFEAGFLSTAHTDEVLSEALDAFRDAAATLYRVYHAKVNSGSDSDYLVDHSGFVYLMGRDGNFLTMFRGATDPQIIAKTITDYL